MRSLCILGVIAALPLMAADATQWRPLELSFHSGGAANVELTCSFKGPRGLAFSVPGFFDGDGTWKVRFTPTVPGKWSYATSSSDRELDAKKGAFTATDAKSDNALYQHGGFLRVSADRHYLTYTDGTPFFWLGDTWWFCPSSLMPFEGFQKLIDTRRRQGFTIAHMASLGRGAAKGAADSEQMKARQIDVAYWQEADKYIRYANDAGIMPVLGMTFHSGLDRNSLEDWKFLWRYVVARYSAYAVSWLICGEYNLKPAEAPGRAEKALALGAYIKNTDPYRRAMTVHPWYYLGDKRQAWDQPWYDFIMFQGGHPGHRKVPPTSVYFEAYHRANIKPVLEGECNYEGIYTGKKGREIGPDDVRLSAYHAIQSGAFGYTYGAQGLWYPTQDAGDKTFLDWGKTMPWWQSMLRPGAEQMGVMRRIYESVDWWKLGPRPSAIELSAEVPEQMRPIAKADGDRTYLMYFPPDFPPAAKASLHLTRPGAAKYTGAWRNPRTGDRVAAAELTAGPGGVIALPDRPDGQDWALILSRQ